MSKTRLQLNGPVRLSEFGTAAGRRRRTIEQGRMALSEFSRHWQNNESTEEAEDQRPYKPHIRNRYKRRRANQQVQSDINSA